MYLELAGQRKLLESERPDWLEQAERVDDDFTGIAPRTLSLMRAAWWPSTPTASCFEATLAKAVQAKIFRQPLTAIIDSSPVHGAGAVADTYELIRGFLRQTLRAAGGSLSTETAAVTEPFCRAKPDIEWQDPAAGKAHLGELVAAGRALLSDVAASTDPGVRAPADLLAKVIDQDIEDDPDGEAQIRRGVAKDRIVSPSDPEMRNGKSTSRRFDGHKMDIVGDEVTTNARPAKDHKGRAALSFVFNAAQCATCPLRAECISAAGGRTVMVGVHHARIEAARAAQADPKTRALLRRRSKIERKIDHLQDLGMHKARYRGRSKTKLQALFAATVANFKRLVVLGAFGLAPELAAAA